MRPLMEEVVTCANAITLTNIVMQVSIRLLKAVFIKVI
jgi:hypothetical protein